MIRISNASVREGNAAIGDDDAVNASFTVQTSFAHNENITVAYSTSNGTAVAEKDYIPTNGTATIAAGTLETTITVAVVGDLLYEENETFTISLTNPSGNRTVAAQPGVGAIHNDEAPPILTARDVRVQEGNRRTTTATLRLRLSTANGRRITVRYATANGRAIAGQDYLAESRGQVTFEVGQTATTITVPVIGDRIPERNEHFFVNLSGGGIPMDAQVIVTILNDD